MDMCPMFILPPTPMHVRSVTKSCTEDCLQRHRADVHDQCEKDAEAEFDFDMEEKFNTDSAYIPCLCQLRINKHN